MTQYQSYILCTAPRSGSTLLCKLLEATGVAGHPDSHFHTPSLDAWLRSYTLSDNHFATRHAALKAIFDAAIAHGTGTTGMFGLRLQRDSFDFFMRQLGILYSEHARDHDRVQTAFGPTLFIHLTRRDKLAQAISLVRAQQTGLWHMTPDGRELERTAAPQNPVYDADAIAQNLTHLTALDAQWTDWFDQEKIAPVCVDYDALSDDPATTLAYILRCLGLDPAFANGIHPPVAKLADAINHEWADRFRKDAPGTACA